MQGASAPGRSARISCSPDTHLKLPQPARQVGAPVGGPAGSTLFFVWQQQRSTSEEFGDFSLGRDAGAVFREHPDNVFVVKASYYIGR